MRKRILAIGIVVALVALAVWYFPVQTVSAELAITRSHSHVVGLEAPLDLLGAPIGYTLHWTAASASDVSVYRCGTSTACTSLGAGTLVASGIGNTGTFHWQGSPGQFFLIVPSTPVNITVQETEPLLGGSAGLAMLVFGAFLVFLGVWLPALPPPLEGTAPSSKDDGLDTVRIPQVVQDAFDEEPVGRSRRNR